MAWWRWLEAQRQTQEPVNTLTDNVIPRDEETPRDLDSRREETARNPLFPLNVLRE